MLSPLFRFEPGNSTGADKAFELEWLETDGRGGYAASTVAMRPARRQHGLLVAPAPGTTTRHVFLARVEEIARPAAGNGGALPLSCAGYAGVLSPRGDAALLSFEMAPWPRATYAREGMCVQREVCCVRGRHTVLVRYALSDGADPVVLELRPLLACREADALTFANDRADVSVDLRPRGFSARPYPELPAVWFCFAGGNDLEIVAEPFWYRGVEYPIDLERGYGGHEDHLSPALVRIGLRPEDPVVMAVSLEGPPADPAMMFAAETERRLAAVSEEVTPLTRCQVAAEDFLYVDATGRPGVLAGYPWFWEWGRDTFVSLPGLTLARDRLEACADVLVASLDYLRDGLLPNVFGRTPRDSHYGSADASLWFARAVRHWQRAGGDRERLLDKLRPALEEIATCYAEGTGLGIAADEDFLVHVGSENLNPTWMDARTSQGPVTPRRGFPVEVNALFHALLAHLEELAAIAGDRAARAEWRRRARRCGEAFVRHFWMEEEGILADVVSPDGRADGRLRPNMVIAAALSHTPLSKHRRRRLLDRVDAELLTPKGLRTLSPRDPDYVGRYRGGPEERDRAYHQGTVWPWLLGHYCEACLRARSPARERPRLQALLDGLWTELDRAGINHVSEVFDGDPPHLPGGTFAQAWNTAEILRALRLLGDPR